MSAGKRYLLDANVFIQAHQTHYGFDICPGFWSALIRQHKAGRVCSIDRVKGELIKAKNKDDESGEEKEDKLSKWVQEQAPDTFFKGTADKKVLDAFKGMVNWVQGEQQFTQEAKSQFSAVADGWLVAYAQVNGLEVVTYEKYEPAAKRSVKIPNVCISFGVEYCDTFEMLRDLKEQFVSKQRHRRN